MRVPYEVPAVNLPGMILSSHEVSSKVGGRPPAYQSQDFTRNGIFQTACRIPVWPFVVVVKTRQRDVDMSQYLVAIQHPETPTPDAGELK